MVGGMTDFHLLPEYKMIYDERVKGYTGRMYLKQGYYNYQFAVPDKNGNPDFEPIEGNWYAAENQYTLLCYYRPRGGQYDQLVGSKTFNSIYWPVRQRVLAAFYLCLRGLSRQGLLIRYFGKLIEKNRENFPPPLNIVQQNQG